MTVCYEIPLNPLQIEALQRTRGYRGELSELVTSSDIKLKENSRNGNIDTCHIVPDSEVCVEGIQKIEEARKRTIEEIGKITRKYPKIEKDKNLTMSQACERFFSKFSEEDLSEYRRLIKNNGNDEFMDIWSRERDRKERIIRSLYGIIGIIQGQGKTNKYFYKGFIIPRENAEAVQESIETGVFAKELEVEDLFLLEFLIERTKDIRNGKTKGHNPRFSTPQLMSEYPGEDKRQLRDRLNRLTGILCRAYGPNGSPYQIDLGGSKHVYWDYWFIPHKRFKLAEETIEKR